MEMEEEMKNEVDEEMKVEKEDEEKDGEVGLNPRSSGRKPALLTTRPRSSKQVSESIE